jgi:hypothetical protein
MLPITANGVAGATLPLRWAQRPRRQSRAFLAAVNSQKRPPSAAQTEKNRERT